MTNTFFLKQNVFLEPLINQWYAWSMLVPPHILAMITTNLHMKIMQSYTQSPQMHANAVKNPKMLGGPFIDLPGNQTAMVKELMERTKTESQDLLDFAEGLKTLDAMLAQEARGNSLVELYQKVPGPLRGYVEIGYDLNNNPSIRFIESMLYKGPLYRPDRQSIRLSLAEEDHRSFALSTPRFADDKHLHMAVPFASEAIDRLFQMKTTAHPMDHVADLIPSDPEQKNLFESLFTQEAPRPAQKKRPDLGDKVRIRYYGHAVLLIETKDVSILTDPVVSYSFPSQSIERFTYEDLPETIDYVLITHNHQDHILFETLLQLRHRIGNIIVPRAAGGSLQDPSLKLIMNQLGFKNVQELDELEELPLPNGAITGVPFFGEHGELHIRAKLTYHIRLFGKSIMCAADSNNLMPEVYDYVRQNMGPTDILFLGMECAGAPMSWLYGPLLTKPLERRMDQSRRLDVPIVSAAWP